MIYVMSDLHGCYEKYVRMLEILKLNKHDLLYILGDVIDRGSWGISILMDMMKQDNIIPILGNHEYMAYQVLRRLDTDVTKKDFHRRLMDTNNLPAYHLWMMNGGHATLQEFLKLDYQKRKQILEYIGSFDLFEELEIDDRFFILVHGGFTGFECKKDLYDYSIDDLVWARCLYTKQYFPDKYLVTGHTPTFMIDEQYDGRIYQKHHHIAIDCGAVYGKNLGCICLDNMEEYYV